MKMFDSGILFRTFNSTAKKSYKTLTAAGAKPKINKANLELYSYLATKSHKDVLVNSKDIVDGIMQRPDTSYAISGILNKGLGHVMTIFKQDKIDPMKAIKEVFAIADNNPKGLELVEKIVDSDKFHPLKFKEVIANGVLPAIEKAKPENVETFSQVMPLLKNPESLDSGAIKNFLERNVNLY